MADLSRREPHPATFDPAAFVAEVSGIDGGPLQAQLVGVVQAAKG